MLGSGCLAWRPAGHPAVRRHLVTAPVTILFDDDTGRLAVAGSSPPTAACRAGHARPGPDPEPQPVNDIRAQARGSTATRWTATAPARWSAALVHTLTPAGSTATPTPPPAPTARRGRLRARGDPAQRSQQGLVEIFSTIVDQLTEAGEVPDGLRPLVDPDHRPAAAPPRRATSRGALVPSTTTCSCRCPSTTRSCGSSARSTRRRRRSCRARPAPARPTPPPRCSRTCWRRASGSWSPRTPTGRCKEVRDKLPAAIKPLSVAVVVHLAGGHVRPQGRRRAHRGRRDRARRGRRGAPIQALPRRIDELRRGARTLHHQLVGARERRGPRARARRLPRHARRDRPAARGAPRTGSAGCRARRRPDADEPPPSPAPRSRGGATCCSTTTLSRRRARGRRAARRPRHRVPAPPGFADLVAAETTARRPTTSAHGDGDGAPRVRGRAPPDRPDRATQLRGRLRGSPTRPTTWQRRREAWMNDALADVRSGAARPGRPARQPSARSSARRDAAGRRARRRLTTSRCDGETGDARRRGTGRSRAHLRRATR